MVLEAPDGTELTLFYNGNQCLADNCHDSNRTYWWRFSPYNPQETWYYILKMFALPLGASAAFIVIFYLGFYENPVLQFLSSVLVFIASLFITSFIRENRRASRYEITREQGLIDVPEDYDPADEARLFKFNLNTLSTTSPKFTIGFVGDIMMVENHELDFGPILPFFRDVKLIVANLEGIVRDSGNTTGKQAHEPTIFDKLRPLVNDNRQMLLCLSNNHSSDYGNNEFKASLELIRAEPNIHVFGHHDTPNVISAVYPINIATATQWSNKKNWECISEYVEANVDNGFGALHKNNQVNIFFPHWSYENERYTRFSIQAHANTLLTESSNRWDLIFGHHSHTRQPLMKVTDPDSGIKKLVVFSGGNFTSGAVIIREQKHIYGIIMKCQIGLLQGSTTQYAIGDVEWRKIYNDRHIARGTKTICIDRQPYRRHYRNLLYLGIAIIVVILLLKVLELFNII